MRGGLFFYYCYCYYHSSSPCSRKGKWIGDFSCTAQPSPSPSPGLREAVSATGGGTTSGLSLGNRGLATGPGGPGAGPDPRPVAGNFVPEVGVGGVRAPVPPGRVRPPTLFSALWGRRIKRGARSRKLRTANYLCSGSSHKQLNKSRLRYLRNNEYLERKALSSPFLFFFSKA